MKIILSRKGFDSEAGGYPSPHFVKSGRLLSFPIPEDKNNSINTGRTYADLRYDNSSTYLDIMEQLGINHFNGKYTHLDPDVNPSVLSSRANDWRGIFGQCSSAQAHLRNKGVQSGDLFLFFGWFRDVVETSSGYKYVSGTDKHIIWGYLQVDEIQNIEHGKHYEDWKLEHPHYYFRSREQNTGYIAKQKLSFAPHLPGYGTLKFKNDLVLTCANQDKRSVWKLPQYFHPSFGTTMSYHESIKNKSNKDVWELHNNYCILNSVGRGQEFVIDGNSDIVRWAEQLFK